MTHIVNYIITLYKFNNALESCLTDSNKKSVKSARKDFKGEHDMIQEILDNINSNDLREFLKVLTAKPHIADQQRDKFLVGKLNRNHSFHM